MLCQPDLDILSLRLYSQVILDYQLKLSINHCSRSDDLELHEFSLANTSQNSLVCMVVYVILQIFS